MSIQRKVGADEARGAGGQGFPLLVAGHAVTFERRRYPGCTYTWAYLSIPGVQCDVCLGDPWPAINWPKKALEAEVRRTLAQHEALMILERAAQQVDDAGSDMVLASLRNAQDYIRTGYHKISGSRGVANLWASMPAVSLPNPMQVAESAVVAEPVKPTHPMAAFCGKCHQKYCVCGA